VKPSGTTRHASVVSERSYYLEVHSTIDRILSFPQTWPALEGEARRCLVHRFPYGVLYSVAPERVFILAVMHLRRDPDYWKHR